jgi:hypothetical protein
MYLESPSGNILMIKSNKTLSSVQDEFSTRYPYLKLEFFRRNHGQGEGSAKKDLIHKDLILKNVNKKKTSIEVDDDMSVGRLESLFQEVFGIWAQVFRKSGRIWLETSKTDEWSLRRQNEQGKELSYFM